MVRIPKAQLMTDHTGTARRFEISRLDFLEEKNK